MMQILFIVIGIIGAYLLGSIPTAVWTGKIFYGIDIRQHGSGNAGATNTFRVLGVTAGIPVLLFDVLKGYGAVYLTMLLGIYPIDSEPDIKLQLLFGVVAVVGHIFPVFAGFKGGKGVATILGAVLAIHPLSALSAIGVFLICLLITNYVSLSSIMGGLSFPPFLILVYQSDSATLIVFSILVALGLMFTHRKNIDRLLKRQESKTFLFKRRRQEQ
jgi:acyl phosphate:glycerol-3-phosphate acyltransferase